MEDEISYLLKLPSEEILKAVLQEALKDLKITSEEEALLAGVKHDLMIKSEKIPKFETSSPFTKEELQYKLLEQRSILKEVVTNTYNRACADGVVSIDEMNIYRALIRKVDEITAKKIGLFIDLDLTTKEPHLFSFHRKIGQVFSNLTATIIMNLFSEEISKGKEHQIPNKETIQEAIEKFSTEKSNKEFVMRFKKTLEEVISIPTDSPADLVNEINHMIEKI